MTITIPDQSYTAGIHNYGPFTVSQAGFTNMDLQLARENWPGQSGTLLISILIQFSYDNGNTWTTPVGFGTGGGTMGLSTKGQPQDISEWFNIPFHSPCQIKGTVEIVETLNTTVTIIMT